MITAVDVLPSVPFGEVVGIIGAILSVASSVVVVLGRVAFETKERAMNERYEGLRAANDLMLSKLAKNAEECAQRDRDQTERIHALELAQAVFGKGDEATQRSLGEIRKAMVTREFFLTATQAQTADVVSRVQRSASEGAMRAVRQPIAREDPPSDPPAPPPRPRLPSRPGGRGGPGE